LARWPLERAAVPTLELPVTSPDLVPDARPPASPADAAPGPAARAAAVLGKLPALLPAWRLREAVIVAVPALVVMVLGYRQRWVGDDGMIYARTVRQVLAGHGPVYNLGERAEACTGTLWQWLVTAATYLSGRDPAVVAVCLGIVLTGAGYALAVAAARKAVRPLSTSPLLPLGMLVLLPVKADWDYATSGLENGLSTAWIALSWWFLVCARTSRRRGLPYAAALVIGLGPLVRPELALVTVVFLVALWCVVLPGAVRTLMMLGCSLAFCVADEIVRAGYYGVLVPLPALTKEAADPAWRRGLAYFANFTEPYRLWIPLLVLLALVTWAPRGAMRAELLAPPVAGLLSWAYVCRVGGDFMHGRMLLPGLFLLMLPLCAMPLTRVTFTAGAGLVVWAVCCALLWRPAASSGDPYAILDEQRSYGGASGHAHLISTASHENVPPAFRSAMAAAGAADSGGRPVLVMEQPGGGGRFVSLPLGHGHGGARPAGAFGFLGNSGIVLPLDGVSVDTLGLAYPLVAHQERAAGGTGGRAGHEKQVDPAWIVADWTDPGTPVPAGIAPARVAAARHALRCGRLAELQASVRDPLTPDRFWRNLTGSWGRTGFRYPGDPVAAEKALCHN
jgi:arabinofuranosyltransferase